MVKYSTPYSLWETMLTIMPYGKALPPWFHMGKHTNFYSLWQVRLTPYCPWAIVHSLPSSLGQLCIVYWLFLVLVCPMFDSCPCESHQPQVSWSHLVSVCSIKQQQGGMLFLANVDIYWVFWMELVRVMSPKSSSIFNSSWELFSQEKLLDLTWKWEVIYQK